jgi:hypothetical protein
MALASTMKVPGFRSGMQAHIAKHVRIRLAAMQGIRLSCDTMVLSGQRAFIGEVNRVRACAGRMLWILRETCRAIPGACFRR